MPLTLEFKPQPNSVLKSNALEVKKFIKFIIDSPFLVHHGIQIEETSNQQNDLVLIKLKFLGLTVIDTESSNLLVSFVRDRIEEGEHPFYLSANQQESHALPDEAVFRHERFVPVKSQNAQQLATINFVDVPDEFCCALSQDIIDEPVFDIRSPHIVYDYKFLMYWLKKSHPQLMPHTNLPFENHFLKINYELKAKINEYMKNATNHYEQTQLKEILTKYKLLTSLENTISISMLNQALRRCIFVGEKRIGLNSDIGILLRSGAQINSQDENVDKRFTALHIALDKKNIRGALSLLYSGASINIRDANNRTALDIIKSLDDAEDRRVLVFTCERLKLIPKLQLTNGGIFSSPASSPSIPAAASSNSINLNSGS